MERERVDNAHFGERVGAKEGDLATMTRKCRVSWQELPEKLSPDCDGTNIWLCPGPFHVCHQRFPSHPSSVSLLSHTCWVFSVYCPSHYMLLTSQTLYLMQDINLNPLTVWTRKLFIVGDFPRNRGTFSSSPGPHPLDARSIPSHSGRHQKCLQPMLIVPCGAKLPGLEGGGHRSSLYISYSLKRFMLKISEPP